MLAALRRPAQNWARYREEVRPIIEAVRSQGDEALRRFTKEFDGVEVPSPVVPRDELCRSLEALPKGLRASLAVARDNITRFHQEGGLAPISVETRPGVSCRREMRPIASAGLYVPGGTAPLVSTVLMLGIPAKLAGVGRIVLCSPPGRDGKISGPLLAACWMIGIEEVFAVGGAQAVAAMAYGTQSVPKVAKIAGPGNIYVAAAKAEVSIDPEAAAIDMLAGPSELMVLADISADPALLAADLLSQAEHDPLAQVVLVATSDVLVSAVQKELARQIESLPRRRIAAAALEGSVAMVVETIEDAVRIANLYAPEHLSIQTEDAEEVLSRVCNAGSVFLGPYSPEAAGDYCSGTNHVLPTSGAARVEGGVSVATFQRAMTVQQLSREGLGSIAEATVTLARAEGLEAHARAVEMRLGGPS
jgi:histidinol dehydrogenase